MWPHSHMPEENGPRRRIDLFLSCFALCLSAYVIYNKNQWPQLDNESDALFNGFEEKQSQSRRRQKRVNFFSLISVFSAFLSLTRSRNWSTNFVPRQMNERTNATRINIKPNWKRLKPRSTRGVTKYRKKIQKKKKQSVMFRSEMKTNEN